MTAEPVKRSYVSPVREQRAAETRAAIRAAAARLFVRGGYAATTLRAVAAEAGVAERTVYAAFPSKRELYRHVLGVAVVGDDEPVAVAERSEVAEALAGSDPYAVLAAWTAYGCALLDRAGDLIFVGIEGAGADPDLRSGLDEDARATHANHRRAVRRLAALDALPDGVTVSAATDVLYALGSPHLHRLLRRDRGWSARRYRAWVLDTTAPQVLRPDLIPR